MSKPIEIHKCAKVGCTANSDGVLAIDFYPHQAVMDHYRTNKPLSSILMGLHVCKDHIPDVNIWPIASMAPYIQIIENQTGTVIDLKGCKVRLVDYNDFENIAYLKMSDEK